MFIVVGPVYQNTLPRMQEPAAGRSVDNHARASLLEETDRQYEPIDETTMMHGQYNEQQSVYYCTFS